MQLHIWSNSNDPTPRVGVQHYKSDRGGGEYLASMLTLFDQKCWSLNSILLSKLLGSVWWKEGREKVTAVVQPEEMERERNTCNREIVQRRTPQGRKRQVGQRRAAALWHPVCAPPRPPVCITIHSLCESRLDLTALQLCMDMCVFFCVYVCSRGCFAAPIQNRWGEMEMKRVRRRTRQRDLSVGSESLCFVDEAGRHPEVLGGRVRLIPHAWLEVWFLVRFHYKVRPEGFWRLMGCCNLRFYVFLLEYLIKRKTSN